jgi:hypothetical protein
VTPSPCLSMESNITTIDFEVALWRLKDLLGRRVQVLVNFRDTFGSCSLQGMLTRIETLPPDDSAVNILLDDRQGITIDPIDTEALLAEPADGRDWWVEFHLPSGVVVSIEHDPWRHPDTTTEGRATVWRPASDRSRDGVPGRDR